MIEKCSFCYRESKFSCKECNSGICIVHVRFLLPYGDFHGEFCSPECINKFRFSDQVAYENDIQEAISYLIEKKEYKTKIVQKKSKEITVIELTHEDTINLKRILYLAGKHIALNIKLRETLLKVKYQTK